MMKKTGIMIEILFVAALLISLTQLINHFALKPALEGNPEPGGVIYGVFYTISKTAGFIWEKAGKVIIGVMIISGIIIMTNRWVSRGKRGNEPKK